MNPKHAILIHDFSFSNDSGQVYLKKGEILLLVDKVNEKWWRFKKDSEDTILNSGYSLLVPSSYIEIIESNCDCHNDLNFYECSKSKISYSTSFKNSKGNMRMMVDDLGKESDETFGSSHESLIDVIEDNKHLLYCDKNNGRPTIKPRRLRKTPLYVNLLPNGNEKNLEDFKKPLPPSITSPNVKKLRWVFDNWYEYYDENGRLFYYNSLEKISSWKPPRRTTKIDANDVAAATKSTFNTHKEHYDSDSEVVLSHRVKKIVQNFNDDDLLLTNLKKSSFNNSKVKRIKTTGINQQKIMELTSSDDNPLWIISNLLNICPPEDWKRLEDPMTNRVYFANDERAQTRKWFCEKDGKGGIYFYENPRPSSNGRVEIVERKTTKEEEREEIDDLDFSENENDHHKKYADHQSRFQKHERNLKAHSITMISTPNDSFQDIKLQGEFKHWRPFQDYKEFVPPPPNKLESSDIILHDSLIQARTLISGKNKRKHWSNSYVVLTHYYLFFFKDQKNMLSPQKSDFVIGLLNAKVEWCSGESSRKNCFKVITFQNQTLLQDDDRNKSTRWVERIDDCIAKLTPIQNIDDDNFKFRRSRSTKYNRSIGKDFSLQGASTICGYTKFSHPSLINDKKKKIRERLLNFLKKRPPVESLREKGIIKDEYIFGRSLELICQRENSKIPRFVHECVQAIEKNDITADGIYRACGNLSTVQKLRFEINQENYQGLWKETDVHVLTGLLKMFFRDMKEPLFPYDKFENLIKLITIDDKDTKLGSFKSLVHNLPEPNFYTLKFLLEHLLMVTRYCKQNRMHIQNLAIVFGPTLIRKMNDLNNLVYDMMLQVQQSQVIEFLLQEYYAIFES